MANGAEPKLGGGVKEGNRHKRQGGKIGSCVRDESCVEENKPVFVASLLMARGAEPSYLQAQKRGDMECRFGGLLANEE